MSAASSSSSSSSKSSSDEKIQDYDWSTMNNENSQLGNALAGLFLAPISQVTQGVYVSDSKVASNKSDLRKFKITHILNCTERVPCYFENDPDSLHEFVYHRIPLEDRPSSIDALHQVCTVHFLNAVKFIVEAKASNTNNVVLIHCFQGVSRSVSVALAYLMKGEKKSLVQALSIIQSKRPQAQPNPLYFGALERFELIELSTTSSDCEQLCIQIEKQIKGIQTKVSAVSRMPSIEKLSDTVQLKLKETLQRYANTLKSMNAQELEKIAQPSTHLSEWATFQSKQCNQLVSDIGEILTLRFK